MSKRPLPPSAESSSAKRTHLDPANEKIGKSIQHLVWPDDANQVDRETLAVALANLTFYVPEEAHLGELTRSQCNVLLKEKPQLEETLRKAIRDQSYQGVISLLLYQETLSTDDVRASFRAFQTPYESGFHVALLRAIDEYHTDKAYNHSMSIIQSSGTGKSRGVERMAQSRFTFLFNLRRNIKGFSKTPPRPLFSYLNLIHMTYVAYPHPDVNVRDYFTHGFDDMGDAEIQKIYSAFLSSLFTRTESLLSSSDRQGMSLPQWWYNYLNADASLKGPDQRRVTFYDEVIEQAKTLIKEKNDDDISKALHRSCEGFVVYLMGQYELDGPSRQQTVACILAFDESQELVEEPRNSERRSLFHNLESVLTMIKSYEVFSIFLSTNTNLRLLAPPAYLHPSLLVRVEGPPHPPITELPFDVFAEGLYTKLVNGGRSALNHTCSVEVMARFGRTLWHSLYSNGYGSIIDLAMNKLIPKRRIQDDENAQLACLGIRIGLDFDAPRETGRKKDLELVESYMRVVFAVPGHREFMRSGTPSEPILAEAAARLLNRSDFETLAPEALCKAFENGFLARGERGEMIGRLLWTLAHDKVFRGRKNGKDEVRYHKPLPLIDFLEGLFHPDHWETIRNATPVGDHMGLPLSEAFKDAYIHFSHFVDGTDYKVIHLKQVYKLLLRGAALSCRRNQRSIDFLTPILVGSPDSTAIRESESSVLQAQIKNRNELHEVQVSPASVCPESWQHPVISLVHELGSEEKGVKITHKDLRSTRSGRNPNAQHYQIVAYGCSSATYGVIPTKMDDKYPMLLGSNMLMEDFPRSEITECASLMKQMNPCYGLDQEGKGKDNCWWFGEDFCEDTSHS